MDLMSTLPFKFSFVIFPHIVPLKGVFAILVTLKGPSMLMRFGVQNHLSIRAYQELSLVASQLKGGTTDLISANDGRERLLPAVLIYGANASGKSNLLGGLRAMTSFILHSFQRGSPTGGVPREPFVLDPSSAEDKSRYDVDFIVEGVRYHYGFTCNNESFVDEWLYAFPSGSRQTWFERTNTTDFYFGKNLKGRNKAIEGFTRNNSLFLSAAAQNAHQQLTSIYRFFRNEIVFDLSASVDSVDFLRSTDAKIDSRITDFLKYADIGIESIKIDKIERSPDSDKFMEEFALIMKKHLSVDSDFSPDDRPSYELRLGHSAKGSPVFLDTDKESRGTLRLFKLISPVLNALDKGKIIVVDELDASLHTLLAIKVVEMFCSAELNAGSAQLIATTHDTNLLCMQSLRRDQIWFTEKNREGETTLYPLTDIKTRQDDNLEKGYLQGRFGAVPFLGSLNRLLPLDLQGRPETQSVGKHNG